MIQLIRFFRPHFRISIALTGAALLASCASPPVIVPTPIARCAMCEVCSVCTAPVAISPPPVPIEPTAPPAVSSEPARGRLERAPWDGLPNWNADDPTDALSAFLQSCSVLSTRAEWSAACATGAAIAGKSRPETIRRYFRDNFEPFKVVNADESQTGLVTGYYEPLLRGSRVRTDVFRYPVYSQPQDLVSVELSDVYADLKFKRLRGRVVGNKLVPYFERSEIESTGAPLRGLELAWVDDTVELFFLQIQGSGQIQLPDGTRMRVGYADQNGHPFRSLGGALIRRSQIRAEHASMAGIKEWARRNPSKIQQFMNINPSYVFFKELPADMSGPIGTLGVPLTGERSIAVDQRVIPLGVPVFLATTFPNTKTQLNSLMVAQDTGGAINGAVRADFYWGFGDAAGSQAGRMKQQGRMWVLLPKGYDPNALPIAPTKTP
ncbi:MAG: murein transglycosylase A [Burkholderiales bacterium]|nr:murein transglycosylase A [Burkholderiales bacterium]